MDVEGALGLRQGLELRPIPTREQLPPILQRQRPLLERFLLRWACREDREFLGDILSRSYRSRRCPGSTGFTFEPSGHVHDNLLGPVIETHVTRSAGTGLRWLRYRGGLPIHRSRG